jgi:apolipoprotein N-acyltransferase
VTLAATNSPNVSLMRLAHAVVLAWGWRRALIAFGAGALSVLALAPTDIWPVMFVTFPILVWLVDGAAAGRLGGIPSAALAGWWFGFGYFLAGLYWVGHAFLVDAKTFGWLLPFAVVALPAGLAVFTAGGLALARLLWTRGPLRIVALAVAFTIAEWLRGHLLSGFPWNTYGYALTGPLALAQAASLTGVWGLTFLAVTIFATPAVLSDERTETPRPWRPLILAVLTLAGLAAYGGLRLKWHPTEFVADVRLRIMQPNLQQDEKFNYGALRPLSRPAIDRGARRHPSDLAGIGVSIFSHARGRRAGADRSAAAAGYRADHRRRARARARSRRDARPSSLPARG